MNENRSFQQKNHFLKGQEVFNIIANKYGVVIRQPKKKDQYLLVMKEDGSVSVWYLPNARRVH